MQFFGNSLWRVRFTKTPLIVLLLAHMFMGCLYQARCASMSTHHYHSSYNHRLDQTSLTSPKEQFANAFKETVSEMRTNFKNHADNFDAFFRELLKVSHANFHKMFYDTYGILYDRHSSIFNDMFRDLEHYYTTGSIDLAVAMKRFFSLLYKKMFEELNAQYAFDVSYLNCTVEHMEEMMPFGELPQKLILQIKRSFIAIRTFVQALNYGNDILKSIMELPITNTCDNRLKAIRYCKNCNGQSINPICQNTCANMIEKACFPYHINLNREWNQYLNDIIKLASRLKTSFNIELVIKPINIKISEAIMIFQENGIAISQRLFSKCGRPVMRKHDKRSAAYNYEGQNYQKPSHSTSRPITRYPMNIDNLINEISKTFKNYKNFWPNMSNQLCSQYSYNSNCNNITLNRSGDVLNYRDKNNIDIINQQIGTLKLISTNLNKAYNGLDVDFESNFKLIENDNIPIDDEVSGSGESSGSGDFNNDDEEDPKEQIPEKSIEKNITNDIYFGEYSSTTGPSLVTNSDGEITNDNNIDRLQLNKTTDSTTKSSSSSLKLVNHQLLIVTVLVVSYIHF